ncbi:hypothetical protein S83_012011, partial [Arachis hypogaea]
KNNSQKSTKKRKRDVVCETTKKKKNFKVPVSKQIADAISRITSTSESRSTIMSTFLVPNVSTGKVMADSKDENEEDTDEIENIFALI